MRLERVDIDNMMRNGEKIGRGSNRLRRDGSRLVHQIERVRLKRSSSSGHRAIQRYIGSSLWRLLLLLLRLLLLLLLLLLLFESGKVEESLRTWVSRIGCLSGRRLSLL